MQRPIVIKLSRECSVDLSVCPAASALWKNGGSDPDAVWHRRSDGSSDEAGGGVWQSVHGQGYFWGQIWGAPLSTGTYRANVCYSAMMRPSCQITLDRLVISIIIIIIIIIISFLSQHLMILVFVLLRFELCLIACEPSVPPFLFLCLLPMLQYLP